MLSPVFLNVAALCVIFPYTGYGNDAGALVQLHVASQQSNASLLASNNTGANASLLATNNTGANASLLASNKTAALSEKMNMTAAAPGDQDVNGESSYSERANEAGDDRLSAFRDFWRLNGVMEDSQYAVAPMRKESGNEEQVHNYQELENAATCDKGWSNDDCARKYVLDLANLRTKYHGQFKSKRNSDSTVISAALGPKVTFASAIDSKLFSEFKKDLAKAERMAGDALFRSFTHKHMKLQEMHAAWEIAEHEKAMAAEAKRMRTDYHNAPLGDNHIHHSAAMTQQHLLDFIVSVLSKDNHVNAIAAFLTSSAGNPAEAEKNVAALRRLAAEAKSGNLTLTKLDVFAESNYQTIFARFDVFNNKYNPFGQSILRNVFLKTETMIKVDGRDVNYMSDLTFDLCARLRDSNYYPEWRVSVYGKKDSEWTALGAFFDYKDQRDAENWYGLPKTKVDSKGITIGEFCKPNVKWMVQFPRIFKLSMFTGKAKNFQEYLWNCYSELLDQGKALSHVKNYISGIDSVDDETTDNGDMTEENPIDYAHNNGSQPSFSYFQYFNAVLVAKVNEVRGWKMLFRPHCGEGGSPKHLVTCFLLADGIQHGTQLKNSKPMQFMYWYSRLPVAMSLSSNHYLVTTYGDNSFEKLFLRGLYISISTDDPLIFMDDDGEKNCLLHEYGIAQQVYHLSWVALGELARNSISSSGYDNLPTLLAKHDDNTEWYHVRKNLFTDRLKKAFPNWENYDPILKLINNDDVHQLLTPTVF